MRDAVKSAGIPEDLIQVVENTSRETTNELMRLNGYLDLLIPRGSARLIQAVVNTATDAIPQTQKEKIKNKSYGKQSIYQSQKRG